MKTGSNESETVKLVELVKLFLDRGANPNAHSNETKMTALMLASGFGNFRIVKLLLERGADPMATNKDGITALMFAREKEKDHKKIVKLLEEVQQKSNNQTHTTRNQGRVYYSIIFPRKVKSTFANNVLETEFIKVFPPGNIISKFV